VASRPKIITITTIIIIMWGKCKRGTVWEGESVGGKGKEEGTGGEEEQSMLYICIYMKIA
jgi:hypothetical protein